MAKQSKLELDGAIVEVLPAGKFKVKLEDMDAIILCYKSGKMKVSHISVITWDLVKVEVSPYDMSQWRITYRYNNALKQWPRPRWDRNNDKKWAKKTDTKPKTQPSSK